MLLKDLTTLTASLASGTLFHVEKSGKAYNIDYTKLAKAIVEEYNGSTLGGSAQTVQAAIAALNSSIANKISLYQYAKSTKNTDGTVLFTPVMKQGLRYTGLLFVTSNAGKCSIYAVGNKVNTQTTYVTKISGDDQPVTIESSTGEISVTMVSWSTATLLVDTEFDSSI